MRLGRFALAFFMLWLAACSGDGGKEPSGAGGNGGSAPGGSAGAGNGGTGNGGANGGPGNTGGSGDRKHVGDPCTQDAECPAVGTTTPTCMKSWPAGGSCTAVDCGGNTLLCTDSASCGMSEGQNRCLAFCNPGFKECRAGYTCSPDFFGCIPTK